MKLLVSALAAIFFIAFMLLFITGLGYVIEFLACYASALLGVVSFICVFAGVWAAAHDIMFGEG